MKFESHSTRCEDLAACIDITTDRFAYDGEELSALKMMWREMITQRVVVSKVVCDAETGAIVAFGIDVCVSDEDATDLRDNLELLPGRSMLRQWRKGKFPFLGETAIASANAGDGVNVVVIHHGYARVPKQHTASLFAALAEAFFEAHRGFNMRSFIHKILAGDMAPMLLNGGFPNPRVYDTQEMNAAGIPLEARPVIRLSLCRDDAKSEIGNFGFNRLFLSHPAPLLALRIAERQLLELAKEGHTDDEIGTITYASVSTIKKRWRVIRDVVRKSVPGLISAESGAGAGRRGTEVRRRVLRYVNDHPEELFPYQITEIRYPLRYSSPASKRDTLEPTFVRRHPVTRKPP